MNKNFYHLFANGDDSRDFIVSESDFLYEFNLVGICTHGSGASVLSFCIEDSHPHFLLAGLEAQCDSFRRLFETSSLKHIAATRGSKDDITLRITMELVDTDDYLMNVAAYTIIQPTKDGKSVMFYDYKWGTGSMYFRPDCHIPIWMVKNDGAVSCPISFGSLSEREKRALCGKRSIPDHWLVCNGVILPSNYVDVKGYERIFRTHNCFRAFCGAGAKQLSVVQDRMIVSAGLYLNDFEARVKCRETSLELFHCSDPRRLSSNDRIALARTLRHRFSLSVRQLATVVKLPEREIESYVR